MQTPAGKIDARAAIVTVSSSVLAAGNIKFNPDIPKRHLDAAARLSLGSFDHIALQLPGNPMGLARDDVVIEQSNSTRTALLIANIGGSSLCSIDVGGWFGRDLSGQGEPAMVAFAVEWLGKLFGSEAAVRVKKANQDLLNREIEKGEIPAATANNTLAKSAVTRNFVRTRIQTSPSGFRSMKISAVFGALINPCSLLYVVGFL